LSSEERNEGKRAGLVAKKKKGGSGGKGKEKLGMNLGEGGRYNWKLPPRHDSFAIRIRAVP